MDSFSYLPFLVSTSSPNDMLVDIEALARHIPLSRLTQRGQLNCLPLRPFRGLRVHCCASDNLNATSAGSRENSKREPRRRGNSPSHVWGLQVGFLGRKRVGSPVLFKRIARYRRIGGLYQGCGVLCLLRESAWSSSGGLQSLGVLANRQAHSTVRARGQPNSSPTGPTSF